MLPEYIKINHPAKGVIECTTDSYVTAKLAALKESYSSLTREGLEDQLSKLLAGEPLNIIGMFMQDDIVL